jgi:uncharacterized protein (UPF0276 family)
MTAPTGIGLGLRGRFIEDVVRGDADDRVAFLELSPENYIHRGGQLPAQLERIAERFPIITHGLTMSLGSTDPLRDDYLRELRPFLHRYRTPWHTDHLCFSGLEGALLHDLLPLPATKQTAHRVAARVREAQDRLGVRFGVENISYYLPMGEPEMPEAVWVREILEQADCALLLDVNNVFVNSKNFGFDPYAWLKEIPLERVVQLHVAGHEHWEDYEMWVDTHGATVLDPVHEMMSWVIERTGPLPVLLERDTNIPPLSELLDEVERLDATYQAALKRRADKAKSASDVQRVG